MQAITDLARPFRLAGIAGAISVALVPEPGAAQGLRFPPVDAGGNDPSLAAFRTQFLDAVRRRDVDFVVANASADIKLSFGGDYGSDSLRRNLTGKESWEGEAYWTELQRVLELGGVFAEDGSFCTPYTFCLDVPGCPDCDPFETVIVVAEDAMVRADADPDARVVARLSYDVLRMDAEAYRGEEWYPVFLPSGGKGFVSRRDARLPVDYRARFEKVGGQWHMTLFIAGD